ncbi:N-acetylglucosaminyl deacetylase, LmbE family [Thermomonospora echinospora]|uniref:N-acetylglucosaminyl deacetylase, LmbE family n=1 Tax=Thermomonospora echinospora TaxID=1992 RepID=A0A1H6E857_9ACTN|nr:PIG-L family deacetylase [Thermomonospora echinospora]SEG93877.1 N-acetylglucosaminyl deacetylase, LmbE family [Thermomonospora echinospora]
MSTPTWPGSVLAVMAHPDDAELWAGGTLALHAANGVAVTIAVASHGAVRDAETAAGAAVLGAEIHLLPEMTAETVGDLLRLHRPEVVITHALQDVHPEHRRAGQAVLEALPDVVIDTGHPRRVYGCETYNGLTLDGTTQPRAVVDISDTYATKTRALDAHRSQPIQNHFGPMAETLARLWGARIGTAYAEAFTAVPVLGQLPATPHL